jgi:hypothetical protein
MVRGWNPGGGVIFRTHPKRPWGLPSPLYTGCRVCFSWVKWPGRGVDHQPPSIAEVKERVEPFLYSHSGPSWLIIGRLLPLIRRDVNCLQNSQAWDRCGSYLASTEELQHSDCCTYHLLWHSETLHFARKIYLKCTSVNFASVKGKLARSDQENSPDRPDHPLGPTEPPLQWVPWLFTGE